MMTIKTVGIIGYGDFGKLIAHVAELYFPHIQIKFFSRSKPNDSKVFFSLEEVCACDILVPSVPIHAFANTMKQIAPLVSNHTTIIEVCSIKMHPSKVLKKYTNSLSYLCTHPMFGPYSFAKKGNSLEGLRMVLTEHNLSSSIYQEIKDFLASLGLVLLEMTSQAHDRKLAQTLFLTHLVGQVVHQGGFERTDIDTVSFGFLMDAVESVKQDTRLFHDVYRYNPYCKKVVEKFEKTAEKVKDFLLSKDL